MSDKPQIFCEHKWSGFGLNKLRCMLCSEETTAMVATIQSVQNNTKNEHSSETCSSGEHRSVSHSELVNYKYETLLDDLHLVANTMVRMKIDKFREQVLKDNSGGGK